MVTLFAFYIYILTKDVSPDRTGTIRLEKGYSISLTHFFATFWEYTIEVRSCIMQQTELAVGPARVGARSRSPQ